MVKKLVLGGLLGAITVFVWGAAAHMVIRISDSQFKEIPNEEAVLSNMGGNITEPGLYFFPWFDPSKTGEEEMTAYMEKYKTSPAGILIYKPKGGVMSMGGLLGQQFVWTGICAFIASFLLCLAGSGLGFVKRFLFVTLLGVFGSFLVLWPYMSWYGFPAGYTILETLSNTIGWGLAGLVMAWAHKDPKA